MIVRALLGTIIHRRGLVQARCAMQTNCGIAFIWTTDPPPIHTGYDDPLPLRATATLASVTCLECLASERS